jgi:glutamate-1-semialdehyde 2,1-aminomutase
MSRYAKSEIWLKRAEASIPLGSQTFSKSRTQYPVGISPLYLERGKGSHVWDLDGNKYLDLVSALASVTLGYSDRGMNRAIKRQLRKGISYTLPGKLEAEVAELLIDMIPSAEMVRFGKNGSDATSAAVRLARAFTGKDRVLVCGYHGWQDWFIGSTTRNKGVPKSISALTSSFVYNDLDSFRSLVEFHKGTIAAVIMEPMNVIEPNLGYLEAIRKITLEEGIVLIFDETITGFRLSRGGAQELFGITPDLSTFGKGIANGMPLSAVVGKREIMKEMEEIFFSGTFGGELLSLAAAKYVLELIRETNLIENLSLIGSGIDASVNKIIKQTDLTQVLKLTGHPSWKFLNWQATDQFSVDEIKTFFLQEMFAQGILILGSHNINNSMKNKEIAELLSTYEITLQKMSKSLNDGTLRDKLLVEPLPPLFKLR